jgi:hypothetical protein
MSTEFLQEARTIGPEVISRCPVATCAAWLAAGPNPGCSDSPEWWRSGQSARTVSCDTRPPLLSRITSDTEGPFGPTRAWAAERDATAARSSSASSQETRIAVISWMVTESRPAHGFGAC